MIAMGCLLHCVESLIQLSAAFVARRTPVALLPRGISPQLKVRELSAPGSNAVKNFYSLQFSFRLCFVKTMAYPYVFTLCLTSSRWREVVKILLCARHGNLSVGGRWK